MTLARALYSSASILLLDDVLAALDVHTAKWVINKAFKGDLVQGRTVLFVTHNIALSMPIAEYALVLDRNGHVASYGYVAEVLQSREETFLRDEIEKEYSKIGEDIETTLENDYEKGEKGKGGETPAGKLVIAEEKAIGRVNRAAFMLYVQAVGGPLIWTVIVLMIWLGASMKIFQSWFLGYWSNLYESQPPSDVPTIRYAVYSNH